MSASDEGDGDDAVGNREVAHRIFAAEYDDADLSYKESEEERAPTYVVTPTGAKANRVFFVGVLTEVEDVNEDMLRARIVDPTGAFVVYAGQYQPDARTFFERATPPEFVAVSGKARTFRPEDGDRVFTSVRPESVNAVDADTRDRWVVDAAERTLERVGAMAAAIRDGADEDPTAAGLDSTGGIALALDHYGTTPGYLAAVRDLATDALAVVAGDRDEVRPLSADPDDPSPAGLSELVGLGPEADGSATDAESTAVADSDGDGDEQPVATATAGDPGAGGDTAGDPGAGRDTSGKSAAGADPGERSEASAGDDGPAGDTDGEAGSAAADASSTDGAADASSTDVATDAASTGVATDTGSADTTGDDAATDATGDDSPGSSGSDGETLGDFEPGGLTGGDNGGDVEVEGAPDEMYELDEEERREIESEYDTEFSTGSEVDPAGEADIETPDPETETADADTPTGAVDAEPDGEPAGAGTETATAETSTGSDDGGATADVTDTGTEQAETPAGSADTGGESPDSGTEPVEGEAETTTDEADAGAAETDPTDEGSGAGDADLNELVVEWMHELDDGDGADREKLVAAVVDETGADPGAVEDAIQEALMGGQCYEPGDGRLKPI